MRRYTMVMCAAVVLLMALMVVSCSSRPKVSRVGTDTVTDFSGRWNDTDSEMVSETMIDEMLGMPWLRDWEASRKQPPVVLVGRIRNNTMEHIDTGAFINDIERELINSGRVSFSAGGMDREEVRAEKLDQMQNATEETIKELGKEIGADYMLFGDVTSFVDQVEGLKAVTYQVDMYLVDIEKNIKVWAGQEKIKKVIEKSKFRL